MNDYRIVIIGSGGVAESFVAALVQKGVTPLALASPTPGHPEQLAARYCPSCSVYHTLCDLPKDADCYLFCVTDTALSACVTAMPKTSGVWMHTAACVPLELFTQHHIESAIFYPLNTFSPHRPLDMSQVPLFYEGEGNALKGVYQLAQLLSMKGTPSTLQQRELIHLSAVFACNFVNHQWSIAKELLAAEGLSFECLHPLIMETLSKAIALDPTSVQTGPAQRGDKATMERHENLLSQCPEVWKRLYRTTSESIAFTKQQLSQTAIESSSYKEEKNYE